MLMKETRFQLSLGNFQGSAFRIGGGGGGGVGGYSTSQDQ